MGYHDAREIPNYWTYAHDFVLQDHMFEPDDSWSLPSHLYLVIGWSARCTDPLDPFSCKNALQMPGSPGPPLTTTPLYAWTDLTYLLHKYGVSWGYYVFQGTEPDCEQNTAMACNPVRQAAKTPGIWNPLPHFETVHQDNQLGNIQTLANFFAAAKSGSHDAYIKFIEDDFLASQRLDPTTDGRPDPRPDVRESNPLLGNLAADFDLQQAPRAPLILPVHPAPGPASQAP